MGHHVMIFSSDAKSSRIKSLQAAVVVILSVLVCFYSDLAARADRLHPHVTLLPWRNGTVCIFLKWTPCHSHGFPARPNTMTRET